MLDSKKLYLLILSLFTFLMLEYLNQVTLVLISTGLLALYFDKKPSKMVRSIVATLLFVLYWFVYGKMIEPEIGLNFLTSIIVLKLLEKESLRDDYMIFYGTLLLVAAGTLFEKNLRYSSFAVVSLILLVVHFLKITGQKKIFTYAFKSVFWMLPLSVLLFIFTPRIPNPFNMNESAPREGEIGYTPSVMISEIDKLKSNPDKVFHAKVESPLSLDLLYWRGNVLEFSDGWNWPYMDSSSIEGHKIALDSNVYSYVQDITMLSKQDFFFALDWPGSYTFKNQVEVDQTNHTGTKKQNRWRPRQNYLASSSLSIRPQVALVPDGTKHTGLSSNEISWIKNNFLSTRPEVLIEEMRKYFFDNDFAYTLSPGRIESLLDFMTKDKKGFCTHYASAVALIMRAKGMTVRLVSGFLGGEYNKYASFYTVSHNDAHVWLEYFENGSWIRLDPTTWIAPDRIEQPSSEFIEDKIANTQFGAFKFLRNRFTWFNDWSQWIAHLDYRYNIWIEELDFYTQEQIFKKYKYNKKFFIPMVLLLLGIFAFIYFKILKSNQGMNDVERLWWEFKKRVPIKTFSTQEDRLAVASLDENIQVLFEELLLYTYDQKGSKDKYKELKQRIKRISLQP